MLSRNDVGPAPFPGCRLSRALGHHLRTGQRELLLEDTPAIFSYFSNFIAAASSKVRGYVPEGIAVVNFRGVTLG